MSATRKAAMLDMPAQLRAFAARAEVLGVGGTPIGPETVIVVGRAGSGTRLPVWALVNAGVYMGDLVNSAGDLIPATCMWWAAAMYLRKRPAPERPQRCIDIQYEDWCREPDQEASRLSEFLGYSVRAVRVDRRLAGVS